MPLHPEYQALLSQLAEAGGPALTEMPIADAREMMRVAQPPRPDVEIGNVTDDSISVSDTGLEIPFRVYCPVGQGVKPMIFMYHGGGWVIGDLDTADSQSREVCRLTDAIVISVDYRLAPEHKFPSAAEDCYAALLASEELANRYNGDPNRIAVAGDSAGGNLAAVVAQMSRDRKGPELKFQLLVYPVTDGVKTDYVSMKENAEGYMLTSAAMEWFWDHYCSPENRSNPYASPIQADDLADLPPALIQTAEFDPLRDEGEAYGERLRQAGIPVQVTRYDGFIHGFFSHSQLLPSTQVAMQEACTALKENLNNE